MTEFIFNGFETKKAILYSFFFRKPLRVFRKTEMFIAVMKTFCFVTCSFVCRLSAFIGFKMTLFVHHLFDNVHSLQVIVVDTLRCIFIWVLWPPWLLLVHATELTNNIILHVVYLACCTCYKLNYISVCAERFLTGGKWYLNDCNDKIAHDKPRG